MAKFLFTTWEGGGHVQPMMLVARGVQAHGHDVLVMSDACNALEAVGAGVLFRPWTTAPSRADRSPASDPLRDWEDKSPLAVIEGLCEAIIAAPAARYAADVNAVLADFPADVIVTQELLFGVMAAAEARNLPLALFTANIWSFPTFPGSPPFGAGVAPSDEFEQIAFFDRVAAASREAFDCGLPALNAARATLRLAPLEKLFDQLNRVDACLMGTSKAFDFSACTPVRFRYVGPYLEDPAWTEAWTSPWPEADERPLVLVTFSSMYQGQDDTLRQVLAALGRLPVRGLVTLGPVLDAADFEAPANVSLVKSAPHSQILPHCAAVITHCGHASTLRPLMAGVPILGLPMGRDQNDNAARAVATGAAIMLSKDAPAAEIETALARLLTEPAFREGAARVGARIARDTAARSAEIAIEALVGTRA